MLFKNVFIYIKLTIHKIVIYNLKSFKIYNVKAIRFIIDDFFFNLMNTVNMIQSSGGSMVYIFLMRSLKSNGTLRSK